jgi:hypothetical protein
MKKIYIEKIGEVVGGQPSRKMENHVFGACQNDGLSIPIEYSVEGFLVNELIVGNEVVVIRNKRNNVECSGFFNTTRLTEIGDDFFKTKNSVYKYRFID